MKSKKVQAVAGGLVFTGFFLDQLMSALSPEDEDGASIYDKIPEYEKEANLIFVDPTGKLGPLVKKMLPWNITNGIEYIKIPQPYGYRVFNSMGRNISSLQRGAISPEDAIVNIVSSIVNNFSPIGSGETFASFLPTAIDPIISLRENRDSFTGSKIMPDPAPFEVLPAPDSERYFPNARTASIAIAKGLNKATGGDSITPGMVSVSPETIDYLFNYFSGAAGSFIGRSVDMGANLFNDKEMAIRDVNFALVVFGSTTPWADRSLAYDRISEVRVAAKTIEKYSDIGDTKKVENLLSKNSNLLALYGSGKKQNSVSEGIAAELSLLNKTKKSVQASDLSEKEKDVYIKQIEDAEKQYVDAFNREYNVLMKKTKSDTRSKLLPLN